jgi:hypothetical protein
VPVESLKLLKPLPLVSLRIRLVESRKTITSFFNSFNSLVSKDNPVRAFSEGACRKSLNLLDVSRSTIRLKDLKPILMLEGLETLVCEGMERERFADLALPHHILSLSLKGSRVNAELLQ